jgi:hypothetical protein
LDRPGTVPPFDERHGAAEVVKMEEEQREEWLDELNFEAWLEAFLKAAGGEQVEDYQGQVSLLPSASWYTGSPGSRFCGVAGLWWRRGLAVGLRAMKRMRTCLLGLDFDRQLRRSCIRSPKAQPGTMMSF